MRSPICIALIFMIGHSWSDAAEVEAGMNIDAHAIQLALEEYTIRATLHDNVEQIPYGVLLRGAYRAVMSNIDRTTLERQVPEGSGATIVDAGSGKENFASQRAMDTLHEACRLLREGSRDGDVDLERIGRLMMLSEDQEYEDLKVYYEGLINELPPQRKREILELADDTSESRVSLSFSRIDSLSMARNRPQTALQLFNLTCDRIESL